MNRIAVAISCVMPSIRLRPRCAPGPVAVDALWRDAGRALIKNAVAIEHLMPRPSMRPREPGQTMVDAQARRAGLAPLTIYHRRCNR
jgi:hypothetical protein